MSQNVLVNNRAANATINTSITNRRNLRFARRFESLRRNGQSAENNSQRSTTNTSITENSETFNPRNTISSTSTIDLNSNIILPQNGNVTTRQNLSNNNLNISNNNQSSLRINESPINDFRRKRIRNIGRNISNQNKNLVKNVFNKKNKKLNEIEEEEKKKEEICAEENIGSEIKDTVKCYICFDKITKPKMCPHCHRIACEKCLYNWFVNLKKNKCGFCRENVKFNEMVSVPFMDAVVNFVEKFFNKRNNLSEKIDNEFLEYCPEHKNEMLYYYCLDCGKAYCKTCFVFFGEEKDKHNGHSIIEYEKYKNMSMPLLKKNTEKLESNIQHVEENIKRCLAYKNSYEYERKIGNKFLKNLQNEFNKQIDEIISKIDDKIKQLKEYIYEYNKYKKEVDYFYGDIRTKYKMKKNNDKSCESLIIKLSKINQEKFFSSKEIEKLSELSKKIRVNTYQSKVGEFNHESMFLSRGLKMGTSPYELVIDNKQRNEVQISLTIPKDKKYNNHNFQAFILIRLKGECVQTYDLDEYKEDYKNYYLIKKIPWDYFGQSIFRIKGMLYEFYFE
jgi:hypothetical protein